LRTAYCDNILVKIIAIKLRSSFSPSFLEKVPTHPYDGIVIPTDRQPIVIPTEIKPGSRKRPLPDKACVVKELDYCGLLNR